MARTDEQGPHHLQRIDKYVGSRIRARRMLLGITQERLAALIAISYQQVQKYETGANRVSASRLYEIAQCLETEVAYFFEGLKSGAGTPEPSHGGRNRVTIDLVRNFQEIANEDQRAALALLVKSLTPGANGAGERPDLAL